MLYLIYRLFALSILIVWVSLNVWAWWGQGSLATCNIGFRLLGFIVWGCSMSMSAFVLIAPPVSDSGKPLWKTIIPARRFIPSLVQVCVLIYISLDIPTAISGGDIISIAGIGISLLLNIIILGLYIIVKKMTLFTKKSD